ncbi:protein THEM6-like [Coccinella septempunctata]|uniref:protein THEM6-like n=1 Tax=Coccinella septempunctata TaxID=41139 RepID=UPI001D06CCB8|nr:protein THEM6-like [Coccinella septempunctata]
MMDLFFQVGFGLACLVIFGYLFFELHYFGRSLLSVVLAKCKKKVHVLDETSIKGICLTSDIDTLLTHMNNARFLRELDFAKIDFLERTGLFYLIRKYKGSICLGATTVRYRRFIKLFSFYRITSKIIYWDENGIYMEHRFIASSDNFVSAVVICKTRIVNCDVEAMMNEALLVPENGDIENAKREKPQMTLLLKKWIEHNELSSALLRNTRTTGSETTEMNGNLTTIEVNGNISKENIDQSNNLKAVEMVGCTNPTFSEQA